MSANRSFARAVLPGLRCTLSNTTINAARSASRRSVCTATRTSTKQSASFLHSYRIALGAGSVTLALALPAFSSTKALQCAGESRPYAAAADSAAATAEGNIQQETESIINVRDLGFGTVAGICTGVFIKKGLKVSHSSRPCHLTSTEELEGDRVHARRRIHLDAGVLPFATCDRMRMELTSPRDSTCHHARSSRSTGARCRLRTTRSYLRRPVRHRPRAAIALLDLPARSSISLRPTSSNARRSLLDSCSASASASFISCEW